MKPESRGVSQSLHSSSHASMDHIYHVSRLEIAEQRARVISMRLGMDIQTWETRTVHPDETVLRQDRPIRLRARWGCHRCKAYITSLGVCSSCEHARCHKCTHERGYDHDQADDEVVGARLGRRRHDGDDEGYAIPDYNYAQPGSVQRKRSKTGGQDLVLRKPRHRVRRTCHVCNADFAQLSKICDKCQHVRCTDCPRDPAKHSKYPFGYPGDVFGPSSIPYYECSSCWALYAPDAENGTPCRRCGQEKSDESPRAQPRAVDADFDPAFLRQLESRLDELEAHAADHFPEQ